MSFIRKLVIFALLAFCPAVALAAGGGWQNDESMAIRLVSATKGTGQEKSLSLGLEMQLSEGWHTYWRTPGDAGLPPTLNWQGSDNLAQANLLYPVPKRIEENGIQTIGYKGRVLLPLAATVKEAGKPLKLRLSLDLLVCAEICIPKHFNLSLDLPTAPADASSEKPIIDEALARVPVSAQEAGLTITEVQLGAKDLRLTAHSHDKLAAPDLILETKSGQAIAPSSMSMGLDGQTVTFRATLTSDLAKKTEAGELPLTATLIDGDRAVEVEIVATRSSPAILRLLGFMALALVGGFILNLMPCVLPVLSLKVLGLVRHGGKSADEAHLVRHSFLATAGGVVFSFLLLAGLTVALKASGLAFGWGVQFQQPVFLVFLIGILTLFACNLFGFFEITLPRFLMDAVDPVHHPKLAGDFATGALATLLATPCTAPFLGTAVGFALAAGALEITAIFLALGLGMATPYLLIALRPSLATRLPRPGNWMLTLTRLLGLGLAGTALWLAFVLKTEIGIHATLVIAGLMLIIGLILALRHDLAHRTTHLIHTTPVVTLFLLIALGTAHLATTPDQVRKHKSDWGKFSEEALARHLREGKTVYVDVTADWCLTCKVNKRLAIGKDEVSDLLFRTAGIVALQADWTNPDPAITAFLRKHNRYGVPFNIVYGPQAPQGIILPELLFADDVLNAIDHARGPAKSCPSALPVGMGC